MASTTSTFTPRWLLASFFVVAVLAAFGAREAWADAVRAGDAVDAISSGRQQFLKGLRGALAAVAAQKDRGSDNLVEELLLGDAKDEIEDEEAEIEKELGLLDPPDVKTLEIRLPNAEINEDDTTTCTPSSLTEAQQHIVGFSPLINREAVMHIALYGCPDEVASDKDYWSCTPQNKSGICQGPTALMYEWTRDKCDDYLAKGEAITVGGAFIHQVVLMVKYTEGGFQDSSGIQLKLMASTAEETGIIETVQYYSSALKDPSCNPSFSESASSEEVDDDEDEEEDGDDENDVPFSAASSSSAVALEEEIGSDYSAMSYLASILEANSQWMESSEDGQLKDDYSTGDSIPRSSYAYDDNVDESYLDNAVGGEYESLYPAASSADWTTRLQDLWNSASALAYGMVLRGWWPRSDDQGVGQVSGVATDSAGNLAILHRGERRWENGDFDEQQQFLIDEPIADDVILTLNPEDGDVISSWGGNRFYMPHGLYIDDVDNMWITDVALHQVFKFPAGSREPELVLGERFVPGGDQDHFCKPTDVAVDSRTGEIYVADGYCNKRVLKFSANGTVLMEITAGTIPGENLPSWSPLRSFNIPHSLALIESRDIVCVADRENARVQCFDLATGELERQFASPVFGEQLYAISYNNVEDVLYAVNGPSQDVGVPPLAFTVDVETGEVLSTWDPYPKSFGVVHDIATHARDGAVYLADIQLDRVWKFETTSTSLGNEV